MSHREQGLSAPRRRFLSFHVAVVKTSCHQCLGDKKTGPSLGSPPTRVVGTVGGNWPVSRWMAVWRKPRQMSAGSPHLTFLTCTHFRLSNDLEVPLSLPAKFYLHAPSEMI